MALATVDIIRKTSSGPIVTTAITSGSTRASTSDSPSPGVNNPIPVPGAGTNYSYWVTERLQVVANPDGHTIGTLKFYVATQSVPSGVTINVAKASTGTDAGYQVATGTLGVSGTLLNQTNHTGLDAAPASIFGYPEGSPLTLTGSTSGTGELGDHVVWQVAVGTTAVPASPAPSETMRFRYDET